MREKKLYDYLKNILKNFPNDTRVPEDIEYYVDILKHYPFETVHKAINILLKKGKSKDMWGVEEIAKEAKKQLDKPPLVPVSWNSPADGRIVCKNYTIEEAERLKEKHLLADVEIHYDCLPEHLKQPVEPAKPEVAQHWIDKIKKQIVEGTGPLVEDIEEELPF